MKKIGVIGSGVVARTLGSGFLRHGYEVMLSSRDLRKLEDWKKSGGARAHTGSFSEAAKFGEIIVLAVKGAAAPDAIEEAGPQYLNGKTVIDTTNPIDTAPPENGVLRYFTTLEESLMEQLQERFPEVHFVKAFNSVGNARMVNPEFREGKPSMFFCGNNDAARREVAAILEQFGHEPEDMGKAEAARAIEPLCMLWCIPGFRSNSWEHAFRLLKN